MIKLKEAIIVEGKYDKIRLESLVDALIITTGGFSIFKDKEKQKLLRRLAETRGLLILTDGDGAGLVIRNFISGCVPPEQVKHAYIPDILGKEKRKGAPSREGKLGVEGMDGEVLLAALRGAGVKCAEGGEGAAGGVTRAMLYEDGLTGGIDSAARRKALLKLLGLPERMSTAGMLGAINALMTAEEYREAIQKIRDKEQEIKK